ncbi:MAG: rRNA maturation RNase YbeY [Verrucomicrobia bacterium]|nr:rRNA maturation RNase YbeY [Verrucomicrobiota bacterium]MBI3869875.1 rRNA maturation RNase YbeY [Verrucomicrobiota bacterium]
MIVVVQNRQRARRVAAPTLRRIAGTLLRDLLRDEEAELGIHLVEPEEMAAVNATYLGHEGSTDVISFDHNSPDDPPRSAQRPLYGELFICVVEAMKFAREFGTTWQSEVVRYVVHGVLHLRGYDDLEPALRRAMKREENRLMRALEKRFAFASLAKHDP